MIIEEQKQLIYRITLTEEEVKSLIGSLSIAKSDWNTSDITNEILDKLKGLVEI